ncbi:MAG: Toxin-antitoxin system, antitoxin component, PHD family [Candidatus Peribacteria bacterium GW2011_GWC2_54_8]|nr:MAG: Toxin-antitoxin system, antitoxin component, PHD family [Candidatus Peribacteria bacterium GW2011_GWC2_54_8]
MLALGWGVRYNVHIMKSMSATDARKQLFKLIEQAGKPGACIEITHGGVSKVVVMPTEDFEGWVETLEVMASPGLLEDIQEGLKEVRSGKTTSLETVKKQLKL